MKNYYPDRMELGPRDIVARAIFNEITSGNGTTYWGLVERNLFTKRKNFGKIAYYVQTVQKACWNRHIQGENGGCTNRALFDGWYQSRY